MDISEYYNLRSRNGYFSYSASRQEHDQVYKNLKKEQEVHQEYNEVDRIALSIFSLLIIAIIIVIVVTVFKRSEVCECEKSEGAVFCKLFMDIFMFS